MRRTTRLVRTPARPDSSADPTGLRPKPRGSRSARAILHTGWLRAGRVLANWKLSGDYRLVWEAVSHRCQEPLREFLEAGGRVSASEVEYRGLRLERRPFTGRDLAGVAYVKRFVDYGGTISKLDGRFVAILPNGLRFETEGSNLVDTILMIIERFVDDEYGWIETDHKVVIDVGANIGDSVVYFANRGAEFVYGYEPEGSAYAAAQRNLDLNHIENAVVENAAVTADGVGGVAFEEVLRRAAAEHPDAEIACKIDCEGCEYELLALGRLEPEVMEHVSQVMVEYHAEEPPSETLEQLGFEVETEPGPNGVGWVRARRAA